MREVNYLWWMCDIMWLELPYDPRLVHPIQMVLEFRGHGPARGEGEGSARADFNLQELPCYLSIYQGNLATFAKIHWKTGFR